MSDLYPSINSHPHQGHTEGTWVATEKIHGVNFSFRTDGQTVQYWTRTRCLAPGEDFFGSTAVTTRYEGQPQEVFEMIQLLVPDVVAIKIFGELFGGRPPVRKGVFYHPETQFLVFDILVIRPGEKFYLSHEGVQHMLAVSTFQAVPIQAIGTFEELSQLDPVFVSTIPELYGLEPPVGNMAEGWVIKLNHGHPADEHRPIFKLKNRDSFCEHVTGHVEEVKGYLTRHRYDSLISKIGTKEHPRKVEGLLMTDMLKDYEPTLTDEEKVVFRPAVNEIKKKLTPIVRAKIEKWAQA